MTMLPKINNNQRLFMAELYNDFSLEINRKGGYGIDVYEINVENGHADSIDVCRSKCGILLGDTLTDEKVFVVDLPEEPYIRICIYSIDDIVELEFRKDFKEDQIRFNIAKKIWHQLHGISPDSDSGLSEFELYVYRDSSGDESSDESDDESDDESGDWSADKIEAKRIKYEAKCIKIDAKRSKYKSYENILPEDICDKFVAHRKMLFVFAINHRGYCISCNLI